MGNQALTVNPPVSTIFNLTTEGSNWLWAVFSLIAATAIIIALLSMLYDPPERTLHLFNVAILTTAAIAYFCMASDLGYAPVAVLQNGSGARQFWYVRYIDWVITTPLLLAELLLGAGLPMSIILSSVFADEVMIITGLIGGLVPSTYKWAFYVFGCIAMFWVFWNIISGIQSAERMGGAKARRAHIILSTYMIVLWSLYPVAWGLSEGSNTISVNGEMIFYGILDVLAKPVFAILTLFLRRNVKMSEWGMGTEARLERIKRQHEDESIATENSYLMGSTNRVNDSASKTAPVSVTSTY